MTKAPLILAALLPYVSSAGGPIRITLAGDAQAVARARVLVDGRPLPAGGQLSDEDYPAQHCVRIEGEGVYVHHWNAVGPRCRYPQLDDSFWVVGSPDATNAVTHTATLTTHAVWVDPKGGRDAPEAAGTADDPFRTLVYAAQRAEKTSVVFCAPGDYAEGEAFYASVTNRVHDFNKALFFRGCGADRCRLVGRLDPTDPEDGRGPAAIRCAAFQNAASALQGFTVTDGRVSSTTGKADAGNQGGAGFNVNFVDCTITNCAAARGQVGRGGSVTRCRIAGNTVANTEGGRLFEDTCPVYSSICFRQNGNGAAPAQQANCPLYQCTVYPGKINGNYPATVLGSGGTLWNCAAKSSGLFSTSWSASATGCVWQWGRQPGGGVVATDHTDADPHFADWENGDCRLVEPTPAEGAGVLPPDYYTWYCTDVNGNPVVFRDGRPLPGAVQAVFGTNWYVNAARPDDAGYGTSPASAKRTLAALCRSADLRSGDVVHVAPGTYGEGCVRAAETDVTPNRAVVPEGVTLVSDAGAEATVIRGAKTDGNLGTNSVRGVYLGKGARLVGFTVCDASPAVSEDAEDGFGGGIYACADCVIADCIVRDNRAMRGGAVRASGGVQILRCRFSGNMARNGASGIYGGGYACCNCDISCDSGYFSYPGSPSTLYLNCTFGGAGEALRLLSGGTAVNCLFDGCGIKDDGTTYRRCLFPSEEFYGKVSAHCEDCRVGGTARDGGSNELYLASFPSALQEEVGRDISGNRRIQGAAIDVGCDEYDLLAAYSRALAPEGAVKVVEEDGEVAEPAAGGLILRPGASLTLGLQGSGPAEGLDAVMAVRVSGSGTFRLLQGETELFSARSSDGRTTFSFRMEKDASYRIVYGGADGEAAVEPLRLTDPAIAASANFSLAGGDGRDAVIVVANPGLPSAELAAQEIQAYVRRITRRTLAVTTQRQAARRIVVGLADAIEDLPEAGRRTLGGTDDPEASWTGSDGRTLWIAGKQPIAELYAAYHFLEAKLGVRWFKGATAVDPGDFVPTADVLEIAPYAEFRKPSFPVRRLEGLTRANELKGAAVAVRNGYQVPPSNVAQLDNATLRAFFAARCPSRLYGIGGRHVTFLDSVPANWFATHPEYFPEIDGVRTGDERVSRHRCMSNPDVRRLVAEDVLRRFEASGGTGYFHYGNWDAAEGHCECADCVALDPPEEPMYGRGSVNVTTRFLKTANAIARAVWEVRPEAEQHVWAYQCYRRPPVGERPDPRFWVQYCPHGRCYGHALDDVNCTYNRTQAEWFKDWAAISSHVYSYEYGTCVDSASLYVCMEVTEPRDVRFYGKIGVAGWRESINFSDVTPSDNLDPVATTDLAPSNWQRFYVTGHVLWDVDVDEAALLEDAESRYYGAAYPAMRKYQDLRRRLWLNNSFCYGYSVGTDRAVRQLDAPLAEERLSGWLDEAERLAAGDPVLLERIGYDRTFFGRYLVKPHRPLASDGCIHALRRTTRIVLDGADDEGAWAGSSAITHFADADGAPMPAVLRTEAALLFDDEALYVLVHAREPDAVAAGDGLRLAFDLPDTNGTRRVGAFLGADGTVSGDFGGAAVVRRTSDGWTLEARLPCEGVFPLRDGDLWRAEIRRVRAAGDWTNGVASDGGEAWRPLFIGRPYLVNSALTEPSDRPDDPNAILKGWTLSSGSSIAAVPNGAGYALSFGSHAIHQGMSGGALAMAGVPRTFDYEIRARGTGQLNVGFYRYGNPTYGKKGAQTTLIEIKRDRTIELQAEGRVFGGTWTIAATEWSGISLSRGGTGDVIVESMVVRPRDGRRRTLADALAETSGGKLATYRAEGGTPPAHGAECPLHVEGFSGPDAELPASGETEASVAALAARLEIAPVPGLVARPFVSADGALMVRYAAAPEMVRRTADEPDPVVFGSSGEGVSLSLRVTNPVRGFWYGLMSSTALTDAFSRQGAAIQSDGSDVRLVSPASQDPARFYRASVWPLNPDETAP